MVSLRELLSYLKTDRRRTFFALLGVAIGATSLVLMDTISGGMKKKVESELGSLGSLLIMVVPGKVKAIGQRRIQFATYTTLKMEDVRQLRDRIPWVADASALKKCSCSVKGSNDESRLSVSGVEPSYFRLLDYSLERGRIFSKKDLALKSKVAVLGAKTALNFFGSTAQAVGKVLDIGRVPFRVIGVLQKRGSFSNEDFDETLFVPVTAATTVLENVDFLDGAVVQAVSTRALERAMKDVESLLYARHGRKDFTLSTYKEVQGTASKTLRLFSVLSRIVAFVAFSVGTLGILAVMALSIYERLVEIAIKRVTGARKRDIFYQFLAESLILSVAGSMAGIIFSVAVGLTVQLLAGWPWFIPAETIGVSMALSVFAGAAAGIYPAFKALEFEPRTILRLFEEQ